MKNFLYALILSVCFVSSSASAALVTNGSMTDTASSAVLNGFNQRVPSGWAATPVPFTMSLSTPDVFHDATDFLNFAWNASQDGGTFVHAAAFGTAGSGATQEGITQSITELMPGQKYAVEFEQSISYSDLSTAGSPGIWEVSFGGATLSSSAMPAPLTSTPFVWQTQSLEFIATATVMDLTFVAASLDAINPRVDLGLDGVSVMPAVIPIPATVWLFGSGLLGLAGIAKRKTS